MLKVFLILIIIIAILGGLGAVFMRDQIINLIIYKEFFEVSVPILGFGALIKYLLTPTK